MRISESEAHRLLGETDGRKPDFQGHYMNNYLVHTSAGEALLRQSRADVFHGYDPRMMPEATALAIARSAGAQVPELLFSDDRFLLERYIAGKQPSVPDRDEPSWITDLLEQVRILQSTPVEYGELSTVYEWQIWLHQYLMGLYSGLPPEHAGRIAELQVPPIDQFWRPDRLQADRRLTLVHSDLHPSNLLVNETGIWILDWELATAADPIWEAAVSLHRTPWPNTAVEAQVSARWLDLFEADASADLLRQYRTIEVWKSLLVDSVRFPVAIAADPSCLDDRARRLHALLDAGSESFGCARPSLTNTRELLETWSDAV